MPTSPLRAGARIHPYRLVPVSNNLSSHLRSLRARRVRVTTRCAPLPGMHPPRAGQPISVSGWRALFPWGEQLCSRAYNGAARRGGVFNGLWCLTRIGRQLARMVAACTSAPRTQAVQRSKLWIFSARSSSVRPRTPRARSTPRHPLNAQSRGTVAISRHHADRAQSCAQAGWAARSDRAAFLRAGRAGAIALHLHQLRRASPVTEHAISRAVVALRAAAPPTEHCFEWPVAVHPK